MVLARTDERLGKAARNSRFGADHWCHIGPPGRPDTCAVHGAAALDDEHDGLLVGRAEVALGKPAQRIEGLRGQRHEHRAHSSMMRCPSRVDGWYRGRE